MSFSEGGFTAGDGGFSIGIRPITGQIYFRFQITQHSRDNFLMNLFIHFFDCGKVHIRGFFLIDVILLYKILIKYLILLYLILINILLKILKH